MPSDDADDPAVIRSEERLHVTTRRVRTGRAILRRTVVTEGRTITVQVRHEEAHLEIVPFDDPLEPAEHDTAEHLALPDFVLHREEFTIVRRVVPVERVRLHVADVTEQQEITAAVRHEVVELDITPPPEA